MFAPGSERRVVPAPVLVELDYLIARGLGDDQFPALLETIAAGELDIEHLDQSDHARAAELMRTYKDLKVGFVDCAVLAVVERLGEPKLATLDHPLRGDAASAHRGARAAPPLTAPRRAPERGRGALHGHLAGCALRQRRRNQTDRDAPSFPCV